MLGEDDCLIKRPLDGAQQPLDRRPVVFTWVHETDDVPNRERNVRPGMSEVAQPAADAP
jgi:hypothetical protein